MELQLGKLIQDQSYEEYAKVDALNASLIKKLHDSPAHAKAYLDKQDEKEPTEALLFGSAFHAALLEPSRFKDFMKVKPKFDRRTNVGKAADAEFDFNLKEGDIVVKEEWMTQITGMLNAISNHETAAPLLTTGMREVCLYWEDPKTGILCKARYDFITTDGIPVDIKTTRDAKPENAWKSVFSDDLLYFLQAGHYSSGAEATGVCMPDSFNFLFIEKEPPYGISVKVMEKADLEVSKFHRDRLVKNYADAKASGIWPCYDPRPTMVSAGDWFAEKYGKE